MFPPGFQSQPILTGDAVQLRPLRVEDYEALSVAAADPETWAGHPSKDRYRDNEFRPYFRFLLNSGGTLTIRHQKTLAVIGCSRYYAAPDNPSGISIGFTFLHYAFWGGDINFAVKLLMLDHAFKSSDTVWFHIDPDNIRSQKATEKLGARFSYHARLALTNATADWLVYKLTKSDWAVRRMRR